MLFSIPLFLGLFVIRKLAPEMPQTLSCMRGILLIYRDLEVAFCAPFQYLIRRFIAWSRNIESARLGIKTCVFFKNFDGSATDTPCIIEAAPWTNCCRSSSTGYDMILLILWSLAFWACIIFNLESQMLIPMPFIINTCFAMCSFILCVVRMIDQFICFLIIVFETEEFEIDK